jgi:hypothetical protein
VLVYSPLGEEEEGGGEERLKRGPRAVRTSLVPSLEFPSTMDRAQDEGPRKRMASTMVPRRRGRRGRHSRRSRAKK